MLTQPNGHIPCALKISGKLTLRSSGPTGMGKGRREERLRKEEKTKKRSIPGGRLHPGNLAQDTL